jgi:hypothetical protein
MATTQQIQIVAVDKTARVLGSVNNRLKGIGRSTKSLETGFGSLQTKILAVGAALGTTFGIRKILQVSSEVEQLGLRFQFLFGSVEEGNKAFETLLDFASKVPFTLQEIQQGAGNLAVISENAEELGKNLQIVGNVAAVTGLDFKTVSEQIQRSFSGGIAAAEIFRERGVRALLGFQNGVSVTAAETEARFQEVFGPNGPFGQATTVLANTYEGVLSMIQDKIFKFTLALGRQGGLFDFAKGILGALDEALTQSETTLNDFAATVGQKLIEVTKSLVIGTARLVDTLSPVFEFVRNGVNNLVKFANVLPGEIRAFGIIGFLLLGFKTKLIILTISSLFDTVIGLANTVLKSFENLVNKAVTGLNTLIDGINKIPGVDIDPIDKVLFGEFTAEDIRKQLDGIMSVFTDTTPIEEMGKVESIAVKIVDAVDAAVEKQKEKKKEIEETINKLGLANQEELQFVGSVEKVLAGIKKQNQQIKGLTVDQQVSLELEKLKLDEMFAQAGVSKELIAAKKAEIEAAVRQNVLLKERKDLENELRSLSGQLGPGILDEFDPEKARFEKSLEALEEYHKNHGMAEEEFLKARNALYAQYDKRREEQQKQQIQKTLENIYKGTVQTQEIESLGAKGRLELAKGLGMDLLNNLGKVNEKAFRIAKAAAIANAIVSTAQGVANALKTLPIPLNFLAAAAVAAQGYAQVAAIRSTSYTGPREKGGPVSAGQNYLVGEKGPEIFSPNAGGQIIPNGAMGEPVTVNFNITTTDARGFDTLLVERRSTIVGIINQAMNSRGKTGVTV